MQRGTRKEKIVSDDEDRAVLRGLMRKAAELTGCKIHAYCIMTNHYHILLETGDIPIDRFFKYMSTCYARHFNKKYGFSGHVFEARYKSFPVRDDEYFLRTSRYIHLNPVRAGMVEGPSKYAWSSYRTMLGWEADRITNRERTLNYFAKPSEMYYREFVESMELKYCAIDQEICDEIEGDEG